MTKYILKTTVTHLRAALRALDPLNLRYRLPVLQMVHFKNDKLTATDLDVSITVTIAATEAKGEALVPFREIKSLLQGLSAGDEICISKDNETLKVTIPTGVYVLPTMDAGEFPQFDFTAEQTINDIPDKFSKALRYTLGCVSTEEVRYYLNGVCLSKDKAGQSVAVGTNGHRLAVHPLGFDLQSLTGTIVPTLVVKIIAHMPAPLRIECASNHRMAFHYAGLSIYTKTIDGTFPDWTRLAIDITDKHRKIAVPRKAFQSSLRRMNALLNVSSVTESISLAADDDRLCLAANTSDGHDAKEYLALNEPVGSLDLVPSYNRQYLLSQCAIIHEDELQLHIASEEDPAIICGTGEGYCLLMPMRKDSGYTKSVLQSLRADSTTKQVAA